MWLNAWAEAEAANARERAREFWARPWAHERGPAEWVDGRPAPPPWPPGYRVGSSCASCPYAACPDCSCRAAWNDYLNPTSPPRLSWWRRMIARLREENTTL